MESNALRPAVKLLVEQDGRVLVLEAQADGETYWILPGGKIEYGETPREALNREIREELSCTPDIGDSLGMYTFFSGADETGDQVVLTVFEGIVWDRDIDINSNPADENIVAYHWMSPTELANKTENPSLESFIQRNLELT